MKIQQYDFWPLRIVMVFGVVAKGVESSQEILGSNPISVFIWI